jgi:hypothetical protein
MVFTDSRTSDMQHDAEIYYSLISCQRQLHLIPLTLCFTPSQCNIFLCSRIVTILFNYSWCHYAIFTAVTEECRLLGCDAVWLLLEQMFRSKFIHSVFMLLVAANIVLCALILSTLMMQAVCSSETLVLTRAT